jgi:predicted nucleic acid-binding Zn ribbon protein
MPDDPQPAAEHNASGLDLAHAVAAALRGMGGRRARQNDRENRRKTPQVSGAHPDDRDPAQLGAVVERLAADRGWSADIAVHGVFTRWGSIVGSEVAAHCSPQSFRHSVVEVRTDSTAWATQLRLLAPAVVRRLNEELGDGTVARIDVRGPQVPSWRRGRRSVRGRGPRDTYG